MLGQCTHSHLFPSTLKARRLPVFAVTFRFLLGHFTLCSHIVLSPVSRQELLSPREAETRADAPASSTEAEGRGGGPARLGLCQSLLGNANGRLLEPISQMAVTSRLIDAYRGGHSELGIEQELHNQTTSSLPALYYTPFVFSITGLRFASN